MAGRIVALVPDMLVEMRIDSAARGLGAELETLGSPLYLDKVLEAPADVLIVDLAVEGLDFDSIVRTAKRRRVPVIGFGPHVNAELLAAAEEAGMDAVYPRSAFVNGLVKILRERLAGGE